MKDVEPVARFQIFLAGLGQPGVTRHLAAAAAAALDHDRDEEGLLHRPHLLDELWDGDAVGLLDAQQDKRLGDIVWQLRLVVKIELLKRFENVIEATQTLSPILIGPVKQR
jgi:hypothetical protein